MYVHHSPHTRRPRVALRGTYCGYGTRKLQKRAIFVPEFPWAWCFYNVDRAACAFPSPARPSDIMKRSQVPCLPRTGCRVSLNRQASDCYGHPLHPAPRPRLWTEEPGANQAHQRLNCSRRSQTDTLDAASGARRGSTRQPARGSRQGARRRCWPSLLLVARPPERRCHLLQGIRADAVRLRLHPPFGSGPLRFSEAPPKSDFSSQRRPFSALSCCLVGCDLSRFEFAPVQMLVAG